MTSTCTRPSHHFRRRYTGQYITLLHSLQEFDKIDGVITALQLYRIVMPGHPVLRPGWEIWVNSVDTIPRTSIVQAVAQGVVAVPTEDNDSAEVGISQVHAGVFSDNCEADVVNDAEV